MTTRTPLTPATTLLLTIIGGTLALATGCAPLAATPAQTTAQVGASPRESAPPDNEAEPALEGVHAERLTLRSDDPHGVAKVVEELLGLNRRRSPDADVRSVFVESRSNELVVVGTDRGIARVRALLSPGLLADGPASEERFTEGTAGSPALTAVGTSEP